ncbi:ras association domain-containing protein 1-like isoform X2 [Limulus polyphemus]|uniref:Ras association domain-containing protein 1-like isoform X2 n=1 Tax=Limulus polyphemus TaxID=6850 RepID=A0ABM1SG00_LIMPO|nr:ras association domain-containing protein 1-like isoform X2 [Limulus polyphemus]
MGRANMYAEYRAGRTTSPATPVFGKRPRSSDPDPHVRLSFNPSGFLQNFGNPFRRKQKPKHDLQQSHPVITQTMKKREFIELASFGVIREYDPSKKGIGHNFQSVQLKSPTWCDLCGEFIWGVYKSNHCLQCRYCHYTCHTVCQDLVTLDCKTDKDTTKLTQVITKKKPSSPNRVEEAEIFDGYIRVHLNLTRPINVVSGTRPPSIYDILKEEEEESRSKTLTSFYLPRDTIKALHVTSEFTAREVISSLLKKFKVADNPHKYALYERYFDRESHCVRLRRIQDWERPLDLSLQWSPDDQQLVLQENETGDIKWEDFTLPELKNFLKILDREENEHIKQVRNKYRVHHQKIKEAIQHQLIEKNFIVMS